jgi:hypothetical protein
MIAVRLALLAVASTLAAACGNDDPSFADAGIAGPAGDFPAALAIGAAGCGVARTETFAVRSSGTADLTFAITSSNAAVVVEPASGTIVAGTTTTFTATVTVPASTAAGTEVAATLTVTSNASGAARSIPVTVTATGAQIEAIPLGFGDAVTGRPTTQPLVVRNVGNAPATVAVGAPTSALFAVAWPGAPAAAEIAGGGASLDATVTFTPTASGEVAATAPLTVSGVVCGAAPPAAVALSGTGVPPGTFRVEGGAGFGAVACGSAAGTVALTVVNDTDHAVAWSAERGESPNARLYGVDPAAGTLAAGASAPVTLTRNPIDLPVDPRASHDLGIVFTATAKGHPPAQRLIEATQALTGPFLEPAAPAIDFGFVPAERSRSRAIAVENTGNAPAVLVATGGEAPLAVTVPGEIAAGQRGDVTIAYAPAATPAPVDRAVILDAAGSCSGPVGIDVDAGTGPYADLAAVTIERTCPDPEPFAEVAVTNLGNQPLTITGCREAAPSGVEPTFPGETFPITIGTGGGSADPNQGAIPFHYTPRAAPATATLTCDVNDPFEPAQSVTITRAMTGADIEISIPDGASLDFACYMDSAVDVLVTYRNAGNTEVVIAPVIDGDFFPYPIGVVGFFDVRQAVAPGATLDAETRIQHSGDGSGSGDFCDQPPSIPPRVGRVSADRFDGKATLPICSIEELDVSLTNNRPQDSVAAPRDAQ